jgi:hypothetical protein
MSTKIPMMVAVRGYAVPVHDEEQTNKATAKNDGRKRRKILRGPSPHILIFDTETGTDHAQWRVSGSQG